ncbi:DUF3575 domain-containing protein [Palleniella muris]|uniref:DUF3575 domain-containing protein n=1 Tax=Palleniella muris TaxID=3038145 RepID=A0AC61QQ81_9BACT|nr:DUF3575 domain-containing protein [Palleniella muris]TGX81488.1 DUF3575 domain-containing protein [Palleniella muris]
MLCLLCAASMSSYAQWVPDNSRKLDTLTVADRLSFRTNGVDWLLMVPNIGIEYDIANNKNWNRWSVGVNVRYKWATSHTFVPNHTFDLFETKLEFRNYWRTRRINGSSVKAHSRIWDKAMSQRRYEQKHPLTTYYRGLFVSYANYNFRFGPGYEGYDGQAVMFGGVYGIQRPLYRFRRGSSIDLELGVGVGLALYKYRKYDVDQERNRINYIKTVGWKDLKILPIVNELRAGLVYRLGKKAGHHKYRFRYDVDLKYAYQVDSLRDERIAQAYRDSIATSQYKLVSGYYMEQLDSIVKKNPEAAKSDAEIQKKERELLKKQAKSQAKEQAAKERAEKKQARAEKKASEQDAMAKDKKALEKEKKSEAKKQKALEKEKKSAEKKKRKSSGKKD